MALEVPNTRDNNSNGDDPALVKPASPDERHDDTEQIHCYPLSWRAPSRLVRQRAHSFQLAPGRMHHHNLVSATRMCFTILSTATAVLHLDMVMKDVVFARHRPVRV